MDGYAELRAFRTTHPYRSLSVGGVEWKYISGPVPPGAEEAGSGTRPTQSSTPAAGDTAPVLPPLQTEELQVEVWDMIERALPVVVEEYTAESDPDDWPLAALRQRLLVDFGMPMETLPEHEGDAHEHRSADDVTDAVLERAREFYQEKLERFADATEAVLRFVVLSTIDEKW